MESPQLKMGDAMNVVENDGVQFSTRARRDITVHDTAPRLEVRPMRSAADHYDTDAASSNTSVTQ